MRIADNVEIVEFGPYRAIGMGCVSNNEHGEFADLWAREKGFVQRMGEIDAVAGVGCFGLCRCFPGARDGAFEYIAALPASTDAPVPDGMMEVEVAAGTYVKLTVSGLAGIGPGWSAAHEWMAAHPEWKGYCGPGDTGCDCAHYPQFELYPPGFNGENELFVYIPVRRAEG